MITNIIFIAIIIAVFLYGCNKLRKQQNTDYFPSLLSSIGVLGTFVGIIIGLWSFDTSDISQSITTLLDGLKTAFITSIFGMAFSMVFTIIEKRQKNKEIQKEVIERNPTEQILQSIQKQTEVLEKINNTILISDGNSKSILEKIGKDIVSSFDNLATKIRENNINALVEVMQKVTEEFSTQMTTIINRLVKENFEQLNTSVERLNTWQQDNKAMLQDITLKYHAMQQSFENTSTTLAEVREKTAELIKDGGKLSVLINNLQKAIVTDNNLDKLTANLKESVENIESATLKYKKTTDNVQSWIKDIVSLQANIQVLTAQIGEIDINRSLEKISNEYYAQLSNTLQALDNCLQAIITKSRK